MIVTPLNATEAFRKLNAATDIAADTETTGLLPYRGDHLFSIILSTPEDNFYFNFNDYPEEGIEQLPNFVMNWIQDLLRDPTKTFYLQNAKYDMHMLAQHQLFIAGKIFDLKFLERVLYNQHLKYSLDEIAKRHGEEKLDIAKKYVEEHKLKEVIFHELYNKTEEKHHYEKIPFSIMAPYGERDGGTTLSVSLKVLNLIKEEDSKYADRPKQMNVIENESNLVHTLFGMEYTGIKINREYCEAARSFYQGMCDGAESKFKAFTGIDFVKGTTVFEEVFQDEKDKWVKTEKQNWKWDKKVLSRFTNPAAQFAGVYAESKKQLEYFQNFLWFADSSDVVHPIFDQAGTVTGRLSANSPNFQNLTNPDKYDEESETSEFTVRRALVPREGFFFAMLDYKQIEYRIFLDMANASRLIELVNSGLDVHEATTKIAPVTRKEAKTVNFLTLYGGGPAKLAGMLYKPTVNAEELQAIYMHILNWKITDEQRVIYKTLAQDKIEENEAIVRKAMAVQKAIFDASPEIKYTTKNIQKAAEQRGHVFNWLGRRYYFSDKKFCYKAPNHLIQGSAADVLKVAKNKVASYLADKKSRMVLTIHDELVLEVAYGEEFVIEHCKKIMESIYPYKRLPLLVDVEYSTTNLADKKEWTGTLDG